MELQQRARAELTDRAWAWNDIATYPNFGSLPVALDAFWKDNIKTSSKNVGAECAKAILPGSKTSDIASR
ncbi:hypothetical protein DSM107010_41140 [Chroococcidiopsis cubana SAG 39.79]|uniref:Uncharacterized protein n=1 Tax=Chroococcidiopsis cubana SAG 39.79 TaxID=388085 RepID=A0AB37UG38_9CYAN|nr:hypothetical protein DSM107010_41140 [Chroococcidiopsis cubana SAG 39.79]